MAVLKLPYTDVQLFRTYLYRANSHTTSPSTHLVRLEFASNSRLIDPHSPLHRRRHTEADLREKLKRSRDDFPPIFRDSFSRYASIKMSMNIQKRRHVIRVFSLFYGRTIRLITFHSTRSDPTSRYHPSYELIANDGEDNWVRRYANIPSNRYRGI